MEFIRLPVQAENKPPAARWGRSQARARQPVGQHPAGGPCLRPPFSLQQDLTGTGGTFLRASARGCAKHWVLQCVPFPGDISHIHRGSRGHQCRSNAPQGDPASHRAGRQPQCLHGGEGETEADSGTGESQSWRHEEDRGKCPSVPVMSFCPRDSFPTAPAGRTHPRDPASAGAPMGDPSTSPGTGSPAAHGPCRCHGCKRWRKALVGA